MKFRLKTLLAVMAIVALVLGLATNWDAIPGTFHKTPNGFPRGTGTTEYKYDNGALLVREWYYRGLIYKSTWFKPDGTEIATETYSKKTGGVGYFLRQDGTIHATHTWEYDPEFNAYSSGSVVYHDKSGKPLIDADKPID